MPTPSKPIKSFKHKEVKRAHIPSAEEAGYEAGSPKVQSGPDQKQIPLNPIIARGKWKKTPPLPVYAASLGLWYCSGSYDPQP